MSEPDPIAEIIEGRLWQSGSRAARREVEALRINAIVCVGEEYQQWARQWSKVDHSIREKRVPPKFRVLAKLPLFDCDDCLDVAACDAAIDLVVRLLSDPERRVLVHCSAGVYRSVHVCAGVVAAIEGCSGEKAFMRTDRRRLVKNPRRSLGMRGWHEHVATFSHRAHPTTANSQSEQSRTQEEER